MLNVLAGRIASRGRIKVSGEILLDGARVNPRNAGMRKTIAFVAQDDTLQSTSTPREAIRFSAKLRLPKGTSDEQLDELTEIMLEELGLADCGDTLIGGPLVKGISGGERKRTSVGVELVVKPSTVLLDEPTTGLDSVSGKKMCLRITTLLSDLLTVCFSTLHCKYPEF